MIFIYIYIYIYICVCVCACACVYVCIHLSIDSFIYLCMYLFSFIYLSISVYIYIYIHIYIYMYVQYSICMHLSLSFIYLSSRFAMRFSFKTRSTSERILPESAPPSSRDSRRSPVNTTGFPGPRGGNQRCVFYSLQLRFTLLSSLDSNKTQQPK